MTPRERFDAALDLGPLDRPPLFYQHLGAAKWVLQHTGLTMREGFHDPMVFAKLATAAHELYGFDNVMAGWGDLLIEAQAHGMEWKFPEKDFYPRPAQYLDLGKVDSVVPVDPMKDRYWSVPLRAASLMLQRIGNEVKVMGCLDSPLLITSELIGMEQALMAEYNSPELVHGLVRKIVESCKAYGEEASRIGLDTIFMDNSSAGGELNSPEFCERFDHSYLRGLMSSFREKGLHLVLHNDSIQPYLEMQLALKPKGLHFHLKSVDMANTFDMLRGKTCTFAGIDHQVLLFQNTPTDIDAEVKKVLNSWGGSNGLVLSGGCELAYKTPVENIKALRDATDHYGRLR
jgi:uroporphyrinogen-III decarboxylase